MTYTRMLSRMTKAERRALADAIRAVLAAVDAGELTADTPMDRRMLRRFEGALTVLDVLDRPVTTARTLSLLRQSDV
jgi:hypothetical protein